MTEVVDSETPRNIVVIMTDQQRADLAGREGFGVDCTPTLDRLARSGCWFNHAYTTAPLCSPARVSLLTGRYPSAHGVRENAGRLEPRYSADLIDVVSAAGYRTALLGKNHSHLTPDRLTHWVEYGHRGRIPREEATGQAREFDDWLRANPGTTVTATPYPVQTQAPVRLVDEAIRWLDATADQCSFLWLSIPEPHVPIQVPEPYFSTYGPERVPPAATSLNAIPGRGTAWSYTAKLAGLTGETDPAVLARVRASYIGMLRLIDDQVARLVQHLEETGRLAETLLVFVSDHGDFAGEYGLMRKGPGVPEVLTRIPMLFHGAGVTPESAPQHAHVSIADILPTICEVVGEELPAGVQGRSLVPLLRGEPAPEEEFASAYVEQGIGGLPYRDEDVRDTEPGVNRGPDGSIAIDTLNEVTQSGGRRMVRARRWKLIASVTGELELFDLTADPYELHDVSDDPDHAQVVRALLARLTAWMVRVADPLPIPDSGYRRRWPERNHYWAS